MNRENEAVVLEWYDALATLNVEKFWALQSPDVVYNISGHTPISGQVRGRAAHAASTACNKADLAGEEGAHPT